MGSADSRKLLAREPVDGPASAQEGHHLDHADWDVRVVRHATDPCGVLALGRGAHGGERRVGLVFGDDHDHLAFVGDV